MPKEVQSAAREVILAVKRFCDAEKRNNGPIIPFQNANARTAALTGVSERTVNRIVSEEKTMKNNFTARTEVLNKAAQGPSTSTASDNNFAPEDTASEAKAVKLVSPGKTRKRKLTVSNLDDFDICVIRRKIQSYYLNNSVPSLRKLHCDLKADINFKGSIESLRKILHKLGYSYKKNKSWLGDQNFNKK